MKTKTIRQVITFNANPHDVYEALMDSKQHSEFTGSKASISRKVNGSFTAHNGYITGKNLKLIKDRKIIQSWHASEWPGNHQSKVIFSLSKAKNGTKLLFTHSGVPAEHYSSIKNGWVEYYWKPLKDYLEKR